MNKLLAAAVGGAAAGIVYESFLRPRHLRWGSTPRERERIWAGDEFLPEAVTKATHAVTVNAPADQVWSWVAQIGQDRGGFYSYTPLENAIGADMRNADRIHPEWQNREVGDRLWLANPSKHEGKAYMVVARWVPERALVMVPPIDWELIQEGKPARHGAWAILVEPIHAKACRLVARTVSGAGLPGIGKMTNHLFWEPAHFIMERAMLLGIKKRAEAAASGAASATARCCCEGFRFAAKGDAR